MQNAQDNYAAAVADTAAAQANLEAANLNLGYTKVFAPVDGYLTNINTSPGTYVNEGQQLLALVDLSSFGSPPISRKRSLSTFAREPARGSP